MQITRACALGLVLVLVPRSFAQGEPPPAFPASLDEAWRTTLEGERLQVRKAEPPGTWEARNKRCGERIAFASDGATVTGTSENGGAWSLRLRLAAWGRGEVMSPTVIAKGKVENHRIEFVREGITEWFVNAAEGLEHGFTVHTAPSGAEGEEAPLHLSLSVGGGVGVTVLPGGRDVRFTAPVEDTVIHYTGLRAWDFAGRELDARFAREGALLSILVDDRDAIYPLTVDPWLWTEQAILAGSGSVAYDVNGYSVAVDGDTALVGAPGLWQNPIPGAAFVFIRSGSSWYQQAKLTASDGADLDYFGTSVAIEGNTAVVGANEDDDAGSKSGSAYVFVRSGTTWSQQAKLTASDAANGNQFGISVSLSGNTALVGADRHDHVAFSSVGAAYVFVRSGTTWSEQAELLASDGAVLDSFGHSVSIDGNTALVGAYGHGAAGTFAGAAYVFERSGTSWSQQAKLIGGDTESGDQFGTAVSIDGETALIGAPHESGIHIASGAAYVMVRSGTSWSEQAKLVGSIYVTNSDWFGDSVSLSGDTCLVGIPGSTNLGGGNAGAANVFRRTGTNWNEEAWLTASNGHQYAGFGWSVSLAGETAVVGAPWQDAAATTSGSAYVFQYTAIAAATWRTGGSNPWSYWAMTLPVLGTTYTASIDLGGTTGHNLAVLVGYSSPLSLTLGGGQALLVNILDANGELLAQGPLGGPLANFNLPIPNDPSLAGFEAFTQALHVGGVQPFALSNTQDLFLGY